MILDTSVETNNIPIRIHNQGDLPLYLQIKYQLSYLITTEKLKSGSKLPPVRTLAADLNVNVHTVAQAYRELQSDGLIQSAPGRGSFVREFSDQERAETERQDCLTQILRCARQRARSMGFADEEIIQRLSSLIGQEAVPCRVVFVDRVPRIAEKYAQRLEHHLGPMIEATALPMADIEDRARPACKVLETTYFVVAFARNVPSLKRLLAEINSSCRILTIASEVVPDTAAALGKLRPATKAVLLSEAHYVHSSLNLLATYSRLDLKHVPAFTVDELSDFITAAGSSDLVLYTFSVGDEVAALDIRVPRLELTFDISADSIEKLRRAFAFANPTGSN